VFSEHLEEWENTVTSSKTYNVWEEELKIARATKNFAAVNGLCVSKVSKSDVTKSQLGLDGWAEMQMVGPVAGKGGCKGMVPGVGVGQHGGSGSVRGQQGGTGSGARGSGKARQGHKEKKEKKEASKEEEDRKLKERKDEGLVRQAFAKHDKLVESLALAKADINNDSTQFGWATPILDEITEALGAHANILVSLEGFDRDLKAAFVANSTKSLKKKVGDKYGFLLDSLAVSFVKCNESLEVNLEKFGQAKSVLVKGTNSLSPPPASEKKSHKRKRPAANAADGALPA